MAVILKHVPFLHDILLSSQFWVLKLAPIGREESGRRQFQPWQFLKDNFLVIWINILQHISLS